MVDGKYFIQDKLARLREEYGLHRPMEISFSEFLKREAKLRTDKRKAAKELGIELSPDGDFGRYGDYGV